MLQKDFLNPCFLIKKITVVTQEIGHCMKVNATVVKVTKFLGNLQDHHVYN